MKLKKLQLGKKPHSRHDSILVNEGNSSSKFAQAFKNKRIVSRNVSMSFNIKSANSSVESGTQRSQHSGFADTSLPDIFHNRHHSLDAGAPTSSFVRKSYDGRGQNLTLVNKSLDKSQVETASETSDFIPRINTFDNVKASYEKFVRKVRFERSMRKM